MKPKSDFTELTQQVKLTAIKLGADLVGVAPVERFEVPPPFNEDKIYGYLRTGYQPAEFLPGAKSVIVISVRHLSGVLESNVTDLDTTYAFGNFGYVHINRTLNTLSFDIARWLEDRSWTTLPLGTNGASRFDEDKYREGKTIGPLKGLFSTKRAAVLAGVGRRANNGLVATPRYGTKVRLGALITTAPLEGGPLLEGAPCPSNCNICVNVCPMQAINAEGRIDHIRCYSDCGRRGKTIEEAIDRIMKSITLWKPTTDYLANEHSAIDGFGNRLCRAACMAFCPLGEKPNPNLARRSKQWVNTHPKTEI
jgi:epoxyqueuosine reductase QueG